MSEVVVLDKREAREYYKVLAEINGWSRDSYSTFKYWWDNYVLPLIHVLEREFGWKFVVGGERLQVVCFKVEKDLNELIESIARRKGITKSELIRRAVKRYIMEEGERVIATRKFKAYL